MSSSPSTPTSSSVRPGGEGETLSPLPEGLKLPDLIITRRTRTNSMSGRIEKPIQSGTVKFFCRSKGHGFIDPEKVNRKT